MTPQKGRWLPCAICRGCDAELAKKPPYNSPAKAANIYCSEPIWLPAIPTRKAKRPWVPGTKQPARKLGKKAQFWADYHKQQDDLKKANFFIPKPPK